jgi:hypothetical protein
MIRTPGKVHSGYFGHPGRQRCGVFYPGITISSPRTVPYFFSWMQCQFVRCVHERCVHERCVHERKFLNDASLAWCIPWIMRPLDDASLGRWVPVLYIPYKVRSGRERTGPVGIVEGGHHRVGRVLSFFSSRRNWDSPNLPTAGECSPHPLVRGGGHTRLRERGWGSPNSDDGTYCTLW